MSRRAPARATLTTCTLAAFALAAPLAATTLAPARARAANLSLQGTGTASAGWTDNILNAPDERSTTVPLRESAFLFQLVPRLALTSAAPRFMQKLQYSFTADLFAFHSEADSYSNTLEWNGSLLVSPTTTLILTLTSLQGKVSTFAFNQPSSGATIAVLPQNNDTYYFNQSANESLEARPVAAWRVTQLLRFNAFVPLQRGKLSDSYDLIGEVGFDRMFASDAVGMVLRADFVDFVPPVDPATGMSIGFGQKQLLGSLVARWRRDWSPFWSSEAALGAVGVVGTTSDPTATTRMTWQPSALAAIRWTREIGSAELRYAHAVQPNALAGATFSSDGVTLQAGFPIVRAKMFFGATGGYQRAQTVSLIAGMPSATAHVILADATIGWQPIPELGLFARYSYFRQLGSPPVMDVAALLPDVTRNTVMIGANVIYPAVTRVRVPSLPGSRVDETDQAGFPELHAPQPR
jgi:hypothetical protein